MITEFVEQHIKKGKSEFIHTIRSLICEKEPALFELLDANNEDIFSEPLLYTFFNSEMPVITLRQILFGYIEKELRPLEIDVYVHTNGIVYLPNIGYLKTGLSNINITMVYDSKSDEIFLIYNGNLIYFESEKPEKIRYTSIEIIKYDIPLLDVCFRDDDNNPVTVEIEEATRQNIAHLKKAFAIINEVYARYYFSISGEVKKIVIFSSDQLKSFATIKAHGIAFINVPEKCNEIFFIEDILHQCGHVIFTTLNNEKNKLIKADPSACLQEINHLTDEHRSIYNAYHDVFVEAVMNECMDICLDKKIFTGIKHHELEARIGFILLRFCIDIELLNHPEIFTAPGLELYKYIRDCFIKIYYKRKELLNKYNFEEQLYTFSYKNFLAANPYAG